jgi:hypothetical protein
MPVTLYTSELAASASVSNSLWGEINVYNSLRGSPIKVVTSALLISLLAVLLSVFCC